MHAYHARGGPVHTKRKPIAANELYQEATDLYRRAFFPLASTAAGIALAINSVLLLDFTALILNVAWGALVTFYAAATISAALILPMAIELRATGVTSPATRFIGLRDHGKHVLLAALTITAVNAILVITYLGILPAIFITTRFGLLAPAIVAENEDLTDALTRSWELTQGLVLRTSVVVLGALAPFLVAVAGLSLLNLSTRLTWLGASIAEGLVIPFVLIVILLLFEDYRTLQAEPDDFDPTISPPKTSL
jgi:hypothetical protein